jgi:uncharacterized membrane protein
MGIAHVVAPKPFVKIIPDALPAKRALNLLAAACEGTAGALLLTDDPKLQQTGGKLAFATIAGVYPANINMAVKAGPPRNLASIAAWLRLPFQFPMLKAAFDLSRPEAAS